MRLCQDSCSTSLLCYHSQDLLGLHVWHIYTSLICSVFLHALAAYISARHTVYIYDESRRGYSYLFQGNTAVCTHRARVDYRHWRGGIVMTAPCPCCCRGAGAGAGAGALKDESSCGNRRRPAAGAAKKQSAYGGARAGAGSTLHQRRRTRGHGVRPALLAGGGGQQLITGRRRRRNLKADPPERTELREARYDLSDKHDGCHSTSFLEGGQGLEHVQTFGDDDDDA